MTWSRRKGARTKKCLRGHLIARVGRYAGGKNCRRCLRDDSKFRSALGLSERSQASRDRDRASHLKHAFGITPEQYDAMLKRQGGVCVICGRPPKTRRLAVEHDHKTKRVRGLACHHCNKYLIGANTALSAKKVLAYLESTFDGRAL